MHAPDGDRIRFRFEELAKIRKDGQLTEEERYELAVLYASVDVFPDETEALLEEILAEQPDHVEAMIWLVVSKTYSGYACIKNDEVLALADRIIEISSERDHAAAGWYLRAGILPDAPGTTLDQLIESLEKSVELAPDWVGNRHSLAAYLERAGRLEEALSQSSQALKNIIDEDSSWPLTRLIWEGTITFRVFGSTSKRELEENVERLSKMLGGGGSS